MKVRILTSVLVLICVSIMAAQPKTDSLAASKNKPKLGFYAGPTVKFSHPASQFGISVGGQAALFINKRFAIGAFGNRLVSKPRFMAVDPSTETNTEMELELIQYGLSFEYAYQPVSFIRLSADLPTSFGNTWIERVEDNSHVQRSTMLSLEPRLTLDLSLPSKLTLDYLGDISSPLSATRISISRIKTSPVLSMACS